MFANTHKKTAGSLHGRLVGPALGQSCKHGNPQRIDKTSYAYPNKVSFICSTETEDTGTSFTSVQNGGLASETGKVSSISIVN